MTTPELQSALAQIQKASADMAEVVNVRLGYRFVDGWITKDLCVVVSVMPQSLDAVRAQLPDKIQGVPVDVVPATPTEQLAELQAAQGERGIEAVTERYATPGVPIQPEADQGERGASNPYEPPDIELAEVKKPMKLLCHSSPDAGWPTLHGFLEGIKKQLTLAIYDFTAPHVAKGLKKCVSDADARLDMIVDPSIALSHGGGPDNPKKDDRQETAIRDEYQRDLNKFSFEWAAVKRAGKTTGGIFPSAYHIKVAVRDGKAFWLSSGNLQSTNQPNIYPAKLKDEKNRPPKLFSTFNREWHIIVENPELAKIYEGFIKWDIKQAKPLQDDGDSRGMEPEMPMLLVPDDDEDTRARQEFFMPKEFEFDEENPVRIQPLLTPDNFAKHILKLVKSAKKSLYVQNQYIKVTDKAKKPFLDLVQALADQSEKGVDVRVILRDLGDTRPMLEALQEFGFPVDCVRLQKGCHNKGILVDSEVVAIGSHNWSSAGVIENRDATLIIHDPDVAAFYEKIFLHDWDNLARQKASGEGDRGIQVVTADEATRAAVPAGMRLVPWDAVYED